MRPQPYVNKFIRSTVPNTISAQHLAIINYLRRSENNRRTPVSKYRNTRFAHSFV